MSCRLILPAIRSLIVGLFVSLVSFSAWSHDHGPEMNHDELQAMLKVGRMAIELTPLILQPDGKVEPATVMKIGKQTIYINSHFRQLVKGLVRTYYELESGCGDAGGDFADRLLDEKLRDYPASGFLQRKIISPLSGRLSFFAEAGTSFAANYGALATIIWVAGEVADDIVSSLVPGAGAGLHFFCSVNKAFVVSGTRVTQKALRVGSYSKRFNRSSFVNYLRWGVVAASVFRSRYKMNFEVPPFEIDREALQDVDANGASRYFGWRLGGLLDGGKRKKWVERLGSRMSSVPEDREAQWLKLTRKGTQIAEKEYLGRRKMRWLWLRGRKWARSTYLAGQGPMEGPLNHGVLASVAVEENILHRSLNAKDHDFEYLARAEEALPQYPEDDVRQGLATEFALGDPEKARLIDRLLQDVERIFDPELDSRLRYYHTLLIEDILTGFIYDLYDVQMDHVQSPRESLLKTMRRHWVSGVFVYSIYQYVDFMRVAALEKDPARLLLHKYRAMESFLRIFLHLQKSLPAEDFNFQEWVNGMKESNAELTSFTPWSEKKIQYSWLFMLPKRETLGGWLPLLPSRYPSCSELARRGE